MNGFSLRRSDAGLLRMNVYFAPLQGFTEAAYRNAHAEVFGGIDAYFSPFVRLEKGEVRAKDLRDVAPENNSVPLLVPQVIAASADELRAVAAVVRDMGYRWVDINLGCPFPILVRKRKGCGLLPFPDVLRDMLRVVSEMPDLSFSVKMRLGLNSENEAIGLLPLLNDLPLRQITLHPRLGVQQYRGSVDLDAFGRFYSKCEKPLVYNGDLLCADDVVRVKGLFPDLSGVMLGRGLLANPGLANELKGSGRLTELERREKDLALHDALFRMFCERLCGDAQVLAKIKPFWEYFMPYVEKSVRKKIAKAPSVEKYKEAVRLL